jgi:hypothetical protein
LLANKKKTSLLAMTRLATLKHMLTVILKETEHGKPWQLINHELNFARLTCAQLESNFQYDPAG